jgi:hypothetical protein
VVVPLSSCPLILPSTLAGTSIAGIADNEVA